MSVERFEEGNRERVVFYSHGGDLIEGEVIEKFFHPKRSPKDTPHVTVTIETRKGEERFTFMTEWGWISAIGQQALFGENPEIGVLAIRYGS